MIVIRVAGTPQLVELLWSPEDQEVRTLLDLLRKNRIYPESPCNGKGTCGKCTLRLDDELRLSCQVTRDMLEDGVHTISLEQEAKNERVLTTGYVPEFDIAPEVQKLLVEIEKPSIKDQTPFEDQILAQVNLSLQEKLSQGMNKSLQKNLSGERNKPTDKTFFQDTPVKMDSLNLCNVPYQEGDYTVVLRNQEIIGIEPGDTTSLVYGVAIDIGTTTAVCALVDLTTGKELASASIINPQKAFGLDVLSRISYEAEHPGTGITELQDKILQGIRDMITEICKDAATDARNIYEVTVAANCTMLHMLLGIDATPIGKSPYAPMFVRSKTLKATALGLDLAPGAMVYCLPSVSSYIGADIVAGTYVCELQKKQNKTLFIDIGTNGEIVLAKEGKLLCCSCAAGPALEGMNISCGMRAADGAIEDVVITENGIKLHTIGVKDERTQKPKGICGSGILAVVKELVKHGIVLKNGAFVKPEKLQDGDYRLPMIALEGKKRAFILSDGDQPLLITQQDVRQVQLAKGAILSGFLALLKKADISMEELDQVMIAGQFGAHLPAESLTGTGILPEAVKDKLVYVGNTSKTGAYMALLSGQVKREMEALAHEMDYLELGNVEGYERLFADCMLFGERK